MRIDRLKVLADYLLTVPQTTFDMDRWGKKTDCGTVCCALGYACGIPEFQAEGLKLEWYNNYGVPVYTRGFIESEDFEAGESFFDLSEDQADYLFNPERYEREDEDFRDYDETPITVSEVVKRINQLILDNTPQEVTS